MKLKSLNKIQRYFFEKSLQSSVKPIQHGTGLRGFSKVGILIFGESAEELKPIHDFVARQKQMGSEVYTLQYVPFAKIELTDGVVSDEKLNWFGIPKDTSSQEWISRDYDLVFYFQKAYPPVIEYLLRMSRAGMKVGCDLENKSVSVFDLMVSTASHHTKARIQEVSTVFEKLFKRKI